MTDKNDKNVLTREKLLDLFNKFKGTLPVEEPPADVVEYNWQKPHYFQHEHEEFLTEFTGLLAKNISANFSAVCHSPFGAKIISVDEHFGGHLINNVLSGDDMNYLEFKNEKGDVCGVLTITADTAIAWVVHMLQDSEIKIEDKASLSSLEESLLTDLGTSIIKSLSKTLRTRGGAKIVALPGMITDKFSLKILQHQELFEIIFSIGNNDDNRSEASLILFSDMLAPMVGIELQNGEHTNQEVLTDAIMANMNKVSLPICADIGEAFVSMSELTSLASGDIIVLDKKLNEKIDVKVEGKRIFSAWPAQFKGKYAIQIDPSSN